MRNYQKTNKQQGFTLVEMLLVLVIVSYLVYAGMGYMIQRAEQMRIDRTSVQMQQILNAGLAYYVVNGSWPPSVACLQGVGGGICANAVYLPSQLSSPWGGGAYTITSAAQLYVTTIITAGGSGTASASRIANIIAGTLPLSYTTQAASPPPGPAVACGNGPTCRVVASVNVPGQNLNNASGVNFAGIYRHGGCVPVPVCPVDANGNTMTPQIFVAPVSVSGVNDAGSTAVYPISSFTAYATGPVAWGVDPPGCRGPASSAATACSSVSTPGVTRLWRVCLEVITEKGDVAVTNTGTGINTWGGQVTLLAITRCAISGEPTGSPLDVYTR